MCGTIGSPKKNVRYNWMTYEHAMNTGPPPHRVTRPAKKKKTFCPFFRPLAVVRKIPKRASRATASVSFIVRPPLALSRNFLKFLIYLCPTRVNFSTASSTTFPHQVEGAALLLGRLPPPFPFSVFPFRPGNPGLFGALLQPPAPEKK